MRVIRSYFAVGSLLVLMVVSGCGQSGLATYPAKGTVTWRDGKPAVQLAQATIELKQLEGEPIHASPRAEIDADGNFSLRTFQPNDGAPEGTYAAVIVPVIMTTDESRAQPRIIDAKYESFAKTQLRVVIEPKENTVSLVVDRVGNK